MPGDAIFVTGTIGDAALGLAVLRGRLPQLDAASAGFLVDHYHLPQPRVTVGPQLIGLATAALDVSDGLIADLGHICEVSDLAAIVEAGRVPLSQAARAAIETAPGHGLATALTGGDDYEILLTAPPAVAGPTCRAIAHAWSSDYSDRGYVCGIGCNGETRDGGACRRSALDVRLRGLAALLDK